MILTYFGMRIFLRFNRYMVECESALKIHGVLWAVGVLIDTWWNVNIYHHLHIAYTRSFNRYMVECEYSYVRKLLVERYRF